MILYRYVHGRCVQLSEQQFEQGRQAQVGRRRTGTARLHDLVHFSIGRDRDNTN